MRGSQVYIILDNSMEGAIPALSMLVCVALLLIVTRINKASSEYKQIKTMAASNE